MTKALAAAAAALAAFPLFLILLVTASAGTPTQAAPAATGLTGTPTALAMSGIPADYLAWYMAAAKTCPGLPWSVLAGIGEVESGHGRSPLPGVHSGSNSAGAEGPMQLEPATFAQFAVNAHPGQPLTPYDPADAIYTAAAMLCANGARSGTPAALQNAVFAYNHAQWYVTEVMAWAARYATQGRSHAAATAIAGRDITVRRFITATGFLSSATLGLAVYAPRHRLIDLQVVGASLAEVIAYLTAAIGVPADDAAPGHVRGPAGYQGGGAPL